MHRIIVITLIAITMFGTSVGARSSGAAPPTKLAIIACRVDQASQDQNSAAGDYRELEWHMPVECMRVVETVTDAAASTLLAFGKSRQTLQTTESAPRWR